MAHYKQSFLYGEVRRASKKISEEKNDVRAPHGTLEVRRTIKTIILRGVQMSIFSVDLFKLARRPFVLKKKDRSCTTPMADCYQKNCVY